MSKSRPNGLPFPLFFAKTNGSGCTPLIALDPMRAATVVFPLPVTFSQLGVTTEKIPLPQPRGRVIR